MSSVATDAGLPPGSELPRSRQTARWIGRPISFLQGLRDEHGDVFTIHLLNEEPWVMVSDPALIKRIFTAPPAALHAGEAKLILEPLVGRNSLMTSDEGAHLAQRRLLLPPFHGSRMERYGETMRAVAEAEIDRWPRGEPEPAAPHLASITLEVMLRTVFGVERQEHLGPLRAALDELVGFTDAAHARSTLVALGASERLDSERFAELRSLLKRTDDLVRAEVRRHRDDPRLAQREDVLSLLLLARHEDGSPLSDVELRDQLMTLIVAGYETTATSLAWVLERLVRHPEALERATAEAAAGGGPYTEAVLQETLRLRPSVLVAPRVVKQPLRLNGHLVPAGASVVPNIPMVHRRPDIYPEPEEFRPERFLERPPGTYTWIPFGGGVRRCIGASFSMFEMRIVLTSLLGRMRLSAADAEPESAKRRLLVLAPSRGGRVVLEARPGG